MTRSQGWNQPRVEGPYADSGRQGSAPETSQYPAWTTPGASASVASASVASASDATGEGDGFFAGAMSPAPEKRKKTVGLSTALALMLAGSVLTGSVVGLTVRHDSSGSSDTRVVNDVLNRPVTNDSAPAAEGSIEAVAAKVLPAVVSIQVRTATQGAEGSGSIISPDGYVLTNHHVVAGGESGEIQVSLNDGSRHPATLVASDPATDVAVIKIDDAKDLPYLEFGDSSALRVGQQVVAVGSPLGLNATVTSGIVSALNRPVRASQGGGESSLIDAIQTDAAVNPGNSGGPLVDMEGRLVGMNSMIASLSSTGGESGSIGLGFAIPSTFAKRMADQLINKGKATHPMLGVQVSAQDVVHGALIREVSPGGPADAAGIKPGDVITRLGQRQIDDADSLIAATRSQDFGATVQLEVRNREGNDPRTVEVTLSGE